GEYVLSLVKKLLIIPKIHILVTYRPVLFVSDFREELEDEMQKTSGVVFYSIDLQRDRERIDNDVRTYVDYRFTRRWTRKWSKEELELIRHRFSEEQRPL